MICQVCGKEVPDDSLACGHCGARVGAKLPEAPRVRSHRLILKRRYAKWLPWAGLAFVILLLSVVAVFFATCRSSMRPGESGPSKRNEGPESKKLSSVSSDTVERYPTMECPDEVSIDREFAVQISLTENLVTPEVRIQSGNVTKQGKLAINDPNQSAKLAVDVILSANDFTLRGGVNTATLQLPRDGDSTPAVFYLRPKTPLDGLQRLSTLYATFWYNGSYVARFFRQITVGSTVAGSVAVKGPGAESKRENAETATSDSAKSLGNTPAAPAAASQDQVSGPPNAGQATKNRKVEPVAIGQYSESPPDVTVYIRGSEMTINSVLWHPRQYRIPEKSGELSDWLKQQYGKFANAAARGAESLNKESTASDKARAGLLLKGFGRDLYKKCAPPDFKKAFWKLVDQMGPRFNTIQIYTDDPLVPWELMRPVRPDGSGEREFLGVEFSVGRWHISQDSDQMDRPPQSLWIQELVVVAPQYEGSRALPGQDEELETLRQFQGYHRLRGQRAEVKKLFESPPEGIVHFAGHGAVGPPEDGTLTLDDWRGMKPSQSANHPFFFFNACDVGQSQRIANFVDGWAPAVLDAGASGYIGALWPLRDRGAGEFARQFYEALGEKLKIGPASVAEVLTNTRRMFLRNGDPTFLAYVYYGDPNLKFVTR
jgi:hypothetical protein